jgi:hypothetical protein
LFLTGEFGLGSSTFFFFFDSTGVFASLVAFLFSAFLTGFFVLVFFGRSETFLVRSFLGTFLVVAVGVAACFCLDFVVGVALGFFVTAVSFLGLAVVVGGVDFALGLGFVLGFESVFGFLGVFVAAVVLAGFDFGFGVVCAFGFVFGLEAGLGLGLVFGLGLGKGFGFCFAFIFFGLGSGLGGFPPFASEKT